MTDWTVMEPEGQEWRSLAATPLLGMLAMAGAVLDLAINRFAVRTLGGTMSHEQLVLLSRWGDLPRNLAAVCGLVALTIALLSFLRTPMHAPVRRRLSIAGFAGIFLPTTALATLLPAERTSAQIVLFATGAANVLVVLLGLTAARRRAPPGLRTGVVLLSASAFFAFCALVIALVQPLAHSRAGIMTAVVSRGIGEVAFLIAPLAIGLTVFPRPSDLRSRISLGAGLLTFAVTTSLGWWGLAELRSDFAIILYGAERVELLLEAAPLVYVLIFAAATGIGVGALASDDETRRQVGAGVLLLVASGYAARSPSRLLMTVLAVALLARACLALGERLHASRAAARAEPSAADDEPERTGGEVDGAIADQPES